MEPGTRIVLASASPRRRELLQQAGLDFDVVPADVDETLAEFETPEEAACALAERKAKAVAALRPADFIIGADTVVAIPLEGANGAYELLGKPLDEREAAAMLWKLSGKAHVVVTGVCVLGRARAIEAARSSVTMRELSAEEVSGYVRSLEWRDKAGGYAIQEGADRFVTHLEGGLDTVVGLPVELTLALLRRAGALVERP